VFDDFWWVWLFQWTEIPVILHTEIPKTRQNTPKIIQYQNRSFSELLRAFPVKLSLSERFSFIESDYIIFGTFSARFGDFRHISAKSLFSVLVAQQNLPPTIENLLPVHKGV